LATRKLKLKLITSNTKFNEVRRVLLLETEFCQG